MKTGILPGHKKELDEGHYSAQQMTVFAVCQWVEFALCLLVLALLVHNCYKILYLKGKCMWCR